MNVSTFAKYESGDYIPGADKLLAISQVLGCPPNDLMGWNTDEVAQGWRKRNDWKELRAARRHHDPGRHGDLCVNKHGYLGCTSVWLSYPQIIPSACANPFLRACAVVAVLKLAGKQCVRFCRSYWSVLPQLDPKTVPRCYRSRQKNLSPASISICNILDLKNLLTVTDRDKPPAPGSADKNVDVTELPLACRWRVLRGCSPHCRRAGGV